MRSAHCIETIPPARSRPPGIGAAALARSSLRRLGQGVGRGLARALLWAERSTQRRRLAALNDHMLRDLGLSRADVMAETTKPFWRS